MEEASVLSGKVLLSRPEANGWGLVRQGLQRLPGSTCERAWGVAQEEGERQRHIQETEAHSKDRVTRGRWPGRDYPASLGRLWGGTG